MIEGGVGIVLAIEALLPSDLFFTSGIGSEIPLAISCNHAGRLFPTIVLPLRSLYIICIGLSRISVATISVSFRGV